MGEAGENLKYIRRGGVNVLVEGSDEVVVPGARISQKKGRTRVAGRRASEPSSSWRNPILVAIAVLGAGVGARLIPDSQSSFAQVDATVPDAGKVQRIKEENIQAGESVVSVFPEPFEEAYTGFFPGEGEEALAFVMENGAAMEKNLGPEEKEHVLSYKKLAEESIAGTHVPADLLLGLIAAESLGDQFARSYAGDYLGLTQMSADVAAKHGLVNLAGDENDDRFIPEKIIPATVAELEEYWDRFGDRGIMLEAWHAGTANVYGFVQTYVEDVYGRRLPDIKTDDQGEAVRRINLYRREIAGVELEQDPDGGMLMEVKVRPNINMYRLFINDSVNSLVTGAGEWDSTIEYVPRIATAAQIFRNSDTFTGEISQQ